MIVITFSLRAPYWRKERSNKSWEGYTATAITCQCVKNCSSTVRYRVAYYKGGNDSSRFVFNGITCWVCFSHCIRVACCSNFTTSMDESDKMAYSSALVSSLSSNGTDHGHARSKTKTTPILGGSWGNFSQSPSNNSHELSHARCSGVFPSLSCTEHAAGYASASNCMTDKSARVPTATCRGVRCRQSTWHRDSGTSASRSRTMFVGGLYRTHACRLEEEDRGEKMSTVK